MKDTLVEKFLMNSIKILNKLIFHIIWNSGSILQIRKMSNIGFDKVVKIIKYNTEDFDRVVMK